MCGNGETLLRCMRGGIARNKSVQFPANRPSDGSLSLVGPPPRSPRALAAIDRRREKREPRARRSGRFVGSHRGPEHTRRQVQSARRETSRRNANGQSDSDRTGRTNGKRAGPKERRRRTSAFILTRARARVHIRPRHFNYLYRFYRQQRNLRATRFSPRAFLSPLSVCLRLSFSRTVTVTCVLPILLECANSRV